MDSNHDIIAIFPLPNVVFFPGTSLPLHIFEPRYCEMVRESLLNKQLIGMFLLQPGWEQEYYGNPPVFPIGCAGEIAFAENLPDEKFNIVLKGLYRVRMLEEIQENPYRKARVEILQESLHEDSSTLNEQRASLMEDYRRITSENAGIETIADFSSFVNSLASTLQLDVETKFKLLSEDDVFARSVTLHKILQKQVSILDWTSRFGHLRPTDPSVN